LFSSVQWIVKGRQNPFYVISLRILAVPSVFIVSRGAVSRHGGYPSPAVDSIRCSSASRSTRLPCGLGVIELPTRRPIERGLVDEYEMLRSNVKKVCYPVPTKLFVPGDVYSLCLLMHHSHSNQNWLLSARPTVDPPDILLKSPLLRGGPCGGRP